MQRIVTRLSAMLKRFEPEQYLRVLAMLLVVLVLTQGLRLGCSGVQAALLLRSLEQTKNPPPNRVQPFAEDAYDMIMEKGQFGKGGDKSKPTVQLFGILGTKALLGADPDAAEPFASGATLPSGETILTIAVDHVILKNGDEEHRLSVFPDIAAAPPKTETEEKEEKETAPDAGPDQAAPKGDAMVSKRAPE